MLISLALLVFSGQILLSFTQTSSASAAQQAAVTPQASSRATATASSPTSTSTPVPAPTATVSVPFFAPNNTQLSSLQLSTGHYVLYQDTTRMYLVSTTDNSVQWLYTPDYAYNQAIRPLLTPDNRLLYTGSKGIWMVGLFDQQAVQLATFPANLTVTSLALSQDGKTVAWTVEPADGSGQISLYAGPLDHPQLVRQQSALDCPCFRIFSFLNGNTTTASTTLLLTDDRGSNLAVQ
ncbi:MAG TPA: hypothetical protein VHD63_27790 [Ktedonobacteraceae bacterium]|nr:hypothetical protein [Ktedonobacteraceae bacterium]